MVNLLYFLTSRRSTGVETLSGQCCSAGSGNETLVRSHLSGSNRTVDVAIPAAKHNHNECFSSNLSCSPSVLFSETNSPRLCPKRAINNSEIREPSCFYQPTGYSQ